MIAYKDLEEALRDFLDTEESCSFSDAVYDFVLFLNMNGINVEGEPTDAY